MITASMSVSVQHTLFLWVCLFCYFPSGVRESRAYTFCTRYKCEMFLRSNILVHVYRCHSVRCLAWNLLFNLIRFEYMLCFKFVRRIQSLIGEICWNFYCSHFEVARPKLTMSINSPVPCLCFSIWFCRTCDRAKASRIPYTIHQCPLARATKQIFDGVFFSTHFRDCTLPFRCSKQFEGRLTNRFFFLVIKIQFDKRMFNEIEVLIKRHATNAIKLPN